MNDVSELLRSRKYDQGRTWSAWPAYEAAESGLLNYWYPAAWASEIGKNPTPVRICAVNIMLMRDEEGQVRALRDRCPHRGVKLSQGIQEFPNTISCPYHRSEEHTSELQSLMRISYAVVCLKKKHQDERIENMTQRTNRDYI